jgi:hypothetical protein
MVSDTTLAILAALGLLGLVVVETANVPQQVKAASGGQPGCGFIPGLDASKTRCFRG